MDARKTFSPHVLIGSFLVLAGGALLLENFGVINIGSVWRFWPLILVGVGIARIWEATSRGEQGLGLWLWLRRPRLQLGLRLRLRWQVRSLRLGGSLRERRR